MKKDKDVVALRDAKVALLKCSGPLMAQANLDVLTWFFLSSPSFVIRYWQIKEKRGPAAARKYIEKYL